MSRSVLSRRFAGVAVATAVALAGIGAAPALAQPTTAVAPTGVIAPPGPFHAAVLAAAKQARRTSGPGSPVTAVRPIGQGVSSDLPTRLQVGGPIVAVPYTVVAPTGSFPQPTIDVALVSAGQVVVEAATVGQRGQTRFTGAVAFPQRALAGLGSATWVVVYGDKTSSTVRFTTLGTTVKLTSLLAERVSRSGNQVSVFGATRAWNGTQYAPRVGVPVFVQRYTSQGWRTIASATTNSRGHISVNLRIPFRTGIRLTTRDTREVFGFSTPQSVV